MKQIQMNLEIWPLVLFLDQLGQLDQLVQFKIITPRPCPLP
jgi:hypothetical protein